MENLPTDIVENILHRLPLEGALQVKRVCKTWKILLRSKTDKIGLLFAESSFDKKKIELHYGGDYDPISGEMKNSFSYDVLRNYFLRDRYVDYMLGSCNGLVCFRRAIHDLCDDKAFLVCNPFTKEVVYVPTPDESILPQYCHRTEFSGFGYCHSTNEYKIVQMYSQDREKFKCLVMVYTIGGGEWRDRGTIDICPIHSEGTYADGALHWLHCGQAQRDEDYMMASFDLKDENFQFISMPRFKDAIYEYRLKLLGGNNLNLLFTVNLCDSYTDIWTYKRKCTNGSDMKQNCNDKNLWHWIKEFSVKWEGRYREDLRRFEALALTRNDELLLRCGRIFYYYDLKTSTLNKLFDGRAVGCDRINAIPHANSIVSIPSKDLGEVQD